MDYMYNMYGHKDMRVCWFTHGLAGAMFQVKQLDVCKETAIGWLV